MCIEENIHYIYITRVCICCEREYCIENPNGSSAYQLPLVFVWRESFSFCSYVELKQVSNNIYTNIKSMYKYTYPEKPVCRYMFT